MIASIILYSLEVRFNNAKFIGPECCTNFNPYCDAKPKFPKLLFPGKTPLKAGIESTILSTWSNTSPNVKSTMFSFIGFFSKFIGNL